MLLAPVARPRRRRVRLREQLEKLMLVRLQVLTRRRAKAPVFVGSAKAREFALATLIQHRPIPTAPQGGLPSVLLDWPYLRFVGRTEYRHSNLNRRLIDHRKSMARLEDVAFAAASVKEFVGVAPIDLFSQSVYVDFDRV